MDVSENVSTSQQGENVSTHDQTCRAQQIREMVMEYITPEDRIILNVVEASIEALPNFESINMSKKVDKKGGRTLVAVTKAENVPHQGLLNTLVLDKVTEMGLNYVCVRNNIGFESFKESKNAEATLFETHAFLSKIKKCLVSIPVLAHKLWLIQSKVTLTDIMKKINDKCDTHVTDLKNFPWPFSSVDAGLREVTRLLSSVKKSLHTILLRGESDDQDCSSAGTAEMLDQYYAQLQSMNLDKKEDFLMDEIMYLQERKEKRLPIDFLDVMQEKFDGISTMSQVFVAKMWNNIERVVIQVFMLHFDSNPQLQDFCRRVVQNLIAKRMDESVNWVREIIGMERLADYTCNPCYAATYSRLLAQETAFMDIVLRPNERWSIIKLEGIGEVDVRHLSRHFVLAGQAFELKMKMIAYWKILLIRHVDFMALHMMSTFQNMVNNDIEKYFFRSIYYLR